MNLIEPRIVIFLFMIYLPTNGLMDKEYFIFNILGLKQILSLFTIIILLAKFRKYEKKSVTNTIACFIYCIIFYFLYTSIKNSYLGIGYQNTYEKAFLFSANILAIFIPIKMLVVRISNPEINKIVRRAIPYGILNLFFFTIFSSYLPDLGFKSVGIELTEFATERFTGIIADGDSNTLGVFFVMAFVYFLLNKKYYTKLIHHFLIIIAIIGIGLTVSRTAIISLSFVIIIYAFGESKFSNKLFIFAMLCLLVLISYPLWIVALERLMLAGFQLNLETEGNRIGKWILYTSFMLRNPLTFLWGNDKDLLIGWNNTFYAAHNFYIQMVYNAGLILLFLTVLFLIKIYLKMKNENLSFQVLLFLIPFIAITSFVSDSGILYYFIIYISLLPSLRTKLKVKNRSIGKIKSQNNFLITENIG